MATGAELIAVERQRQIEAKGWTPEHDDRHGAGQMAWAAVCYAAPERIYLRHDWADSVEFGDPWPDGWRSTRFDGNVPRVAGTLAERLDWLVKAGALVAAEIERLQRANDRLQSVIE